MQVALFFCSTLITTSSGSFFLKCCCEAAADGSLVEKLGGILLGHTFTLELDLHKVGSSSTLRLIHYFPVKRVAVAANGTREKPIEFQREALRTIHIAGRPWTNIMRVQVALQQQLDPLLKNRRYPAWLHLPSYQDLDFPKVEINSRLPPIHPSLVERVSLERNKKWYMASSDRGGRFTG